MMLDSTHSRPMILDSTHSVPDEASDQMMVLDSAHTVCNTVAFSVTLVPRSTESSRLPIPQGRCLVLHEDNVVSMHLRDGVLGLPCSWNGTRAFVRSAQREVPVTLFSQPFTLRCLHDGMAHVAYADGTRILVHTVPRHSVSADVVVKLGFKRRADATLVVHHSKVTDPSAIVEVNGVLVPNTPPTVADHLRVQLRVIRELISRYGFTHVLYPAEANGGWKSTCPLPADVRALIADGLQALRQCTLPKSPPPLPGCSCYAQPQLQGKPTNVLTIRIDRQTLRFKTMWQDEVPMTCLGHRTSALRVRHENSYRLLDAFFDKVKGVLQETGCKRFTFNACRGEMGLMACVSGQPGLDLYITKKIHELRSVKVPSRAGGAGADHPSSLAMVGRGVDIGQQA